MAKSKKGVSLAQSGGRNKTFGGGKGGLASAKSATSGKKVGGGTLNNGLHYNVRSPGGDKHLVHDSPTVGSPPPLRGGGAKQVKVTVRKPARGGAN